ncbi:RadC family protein [Gabonibacter chumensis]|uniref:RadC family protein n=1 Tax=Gabonibacter chumensis TaxID=2972474 RepID=UPI002573B47E|nr:DNA repair protein RadC [Gabonibacter chumensis]MCR9010969.1 DNA repair protein RadC [Gabonibacter chumensis]
MDGKYIPISSWAEDDKPREKLLSKGVSALSTNELLAILLRSGSDGESALDLARRILSDHNNDLNVVARLGVRDFMNIYKGIGVAKAASVIAAFELGRRRGLVGKTDVMTLVSSRDIYELLQPRIGDLDHEEFWVIFLNTGCRVKSCERLFSGGMEGTLVDMRILFRKALEMKARSFVIAHNHPSGNIEPSNQDIELTRKIRKAGDTLDIILLDHLVITSHGFYSFADCGIL